VPSRSGTVRLEMTFSLGHTAVTMSRTVRIILIAGLLLAGLVAFFYGGRPVPSTGSPGADMTGGASSKMIGRSAVSHGGPTQADERPAGGRPIPSQAEDRLAEKAAGSHSGP
jgi:hypothetical protein